MPLPNKPKRLVRGVGINDVPTPVTKAVNGVKWRCPYYQIWWLMLDRCYSDSVHINHPTYEACSVVPSWIYFSNFKSWMETQDWQGKQLDKDILVQGNKVYGPDVCVFVSRDVNMFMVDREDVGRNLPQGVKLTKENNFSAQVKYKGKSVHIGTYKTPSQAGEAYKLRKQRLAVELANEQEDIRVKNAILNKFNGGGHWTEVVERALK